MKRRSASIEVRMKAYVQFKETMLTSVVFPFEKQNFILKMEDLIYMKEELKHIDCMPIVLLTDNDNSFKLIQRNTLFRRLEFSFIAPARKIKVSSK